MDLVIIIVIALAVCIYYGFMKSLEEGAVVANREVKHLSKKHKVSTIKRTYDMRDEINEEIVKGAIEVNEMIRQIEEL